MILFGTFFFPEPRFLIDYIQNLKSSEKSLKEQVCTWVITCVYISIWRSWFSNKVWLLFLSFQLEIAKRKEASCIVQYAKREQEMAELKVILEKLIAYHFDSW